MLQCICAGISHTPDFRPGRDRDRGELSGNWICAESDAFSGTIPTRERDGKIGVDCNGASLGAFCQVRGPEGRQS